jgi:hypothetical protein
MKPARLRTNHRQRHDLLRAQNSACAVLVPHHLVRFLSESVASFDGRISQYFRYLLHKNRWALASGQLTPRTAIRRRYQAAGHSLKRFSFRPDLESYNEFQLYAATMGMSVCHLFVVLLKAEKEGSTEDVEVSTWTLKGYDREFPGCVELKLRVYIRAGVLTRRLQIKPRPMRHLPPKLTAWLKFKKMI